MCSKLQLSFDDVLTSRASTLSYQGTKLGFRSTNSKDTNSLILRHQPQGLWPYLSRWFKSKDCPSTLSSTSFLPRPSSSISPSMSARPSALFSSTRPFNFLFLPLNLSASFFLLFLRLPLSLQVHELWTSLCSIFVLEIDTQNWSV